MTETYLYVLYDPNDGSILSVHTLMVKAKKQRLVMLPESSVDLSDNQPLFEAVKENPGQYQVVNGAIVPRDDE